MPNDDGFVNKKRCGTCLSSTKMRLFTQNQAEFKTKASRFQIPITAQPQHRGTITVLISCFKTYAIPLDLRHDSMLTKIWTISHGKITNFCSRFTRLRRGLSASSVADLPAIFFIRRLCGGLEGLAPIHKFI
jgi:hypothetical protein